MRSIKERIVNRLVVFFNFRTVAAILAVIILIAGGIAVEKTSITVVKTGVGLFVIHDNISFYNESYRKSDEFTAAVEEQFRIRQERYYDSKDPVVRTFSNMFVLFKLFFFLLAIVFIAVTPFVCAVKIRDQFYILYRRAKETARICSAYEMSDYDGDVIKFEDYLRTKRLQERRKASGMR